MIILKIHVGNSVSLKPKSDPPIACYRDSVLSFPFTPKRVKFPPRHSPHLREVISKFQRGEDRFNLPDILRGQTGIVITFIKAPESSVPESRYNHEDQVYGITVRTSSFKRGKHQGGVWHITGSPFCTSHQQLKIGSLKGTGA